jgi:hypothetical protein
LGKEETDRQTGQKSMSLPSAAVRASKEMAIRTAASRPFQRNFMIKMAIFFEEREEEEEREEMSRHLREWLLGQKFRSEVERKKKRDGLPRRWQRRSVRVSE